MVGTNNIPADVLDWLLENNYGNPIAVCSVSGGCINDGSQMVTSSGYSFFLKINHSVPGDFFQREAEGLIALKKEGTPRVPEPLVFGKSFLLMEDLKPSNPVRQYWETMGHQLAQLHKYTYEKFGFEQNNYIGKTPQLNSWSKDGHAFFASNRLLYQGRLAYRNGLLRDSDLSALEKLAGRLNEIIPLQPASLLHGDLWSGNVIPDDMGNPALIDPAVYYGWAEAELAMTSLFGSFPEQFYRAYEEVYPVEQGYWERFPVYNLYHLLNHLNMFGRSYYPQVLRILRRFA